MMVMIPAETIKMWENETAGRARAREAEPTVLSLALRNARDAAFDEAIDAIQTLRNIAAGDFKDPKCQGQRGADRCDALADAQVAISNLKR